jgi:hypothetical protein
VLLRKQSGYEPAFPHFDQADEDAEKKGLVLAKAGISEYILRVEIHSVDACGRGGKQEGWT